MAEITYYVDIDRLDETIEKIFTQIPEEAQRKIFNEVVYRVEENLRISAPKKGGGLANSIRTLIVSKFEALTGPTKKVDGYNLGLILEKGSAGGQTLRPTTKKWMRFFWEKTGQVHYAKKVTRGAIAPRWWVARTLKRLIPEVTEIVFSGWRREYEKGAM